MYKIGKLKKALINANAPKNRVFFVHVPKCGGSSVVETLREVFGWGRFYRKSYIFGLDPSVSRIVANNCGLDVQILRNSLLAYHLEISKARFIYGHFALSQNTINTYSHDWKFVTMLRKPKNRILSEYYYNRLKFNRDHYGTELSLDDWLETEDAKYAASSFLRYFCGDLSCAKYVIEHSHDPSSLKEQIDSSLDNLKKFVVVGSIEKAAAFERDIQGKLFRSISLPQKNKSPQENYLRFNEQPLQIRRKIEHICSADSYLYSKYMEALPEQK